MTIQSDFTGASQKATAIKSATDKLIQAISITEDTKTTVAGNTNAQEAIKVVQESASQIAQAVSLASSNLQSVAKEFEALDQRVATTMLQPFGGLNE